MRKMKVAVCFSGSPRGNYKENISRFRRIFPDHDFFFSTWRGYEVEGENYTIYEEPKSDYLQRDGVHKRFIKSKSGNEYYVRNVLNGCKQILGHSLQLLFDVPRDYNMIIRCRYDAVLNESIDWAHFLNKSFDTNTVFGISSERVGLFEIFHWDSLFETTNKPQYSKLNDMLIFHERQNFNIQKVFELHQKELLNTGELGWYQSFPDAVYPINKRLSRIATIRCFVGGMVIEKDKEDMELLRKSGRRHLEKSP